MSSSDKDVAGTQPAAGDRYWFLGNLGIVRVAGADTKGRLCAVEVLAPAASEAPPHHHDDDEVFLVLEGVLHVTVDGDRVTARSGDTVHVPGGVPHGYAVDGGAPARWIVINSPAGFDSLIAEIAEPAEAEVLPPPMDPAALAAVMAKLMPAAERHGMVLLLPDGA